VNSSLNLTSQATADVSSDGRLLRADEAIMRLHQQAGGVEGGIFAVPSLAAIARSTHQIKMRLARAVRVASDNNNIELWVESELLGDIATLSVSGWRAVDANPPQDKIDRDKQNDKGNNDGELLFDRNFRLVSAAGDVANFIDTKSIGAPAGDIFDTDRGNANILLSFMEKQELARVDGVFFKGHNTAYTILADVKSNAEGVFTGYLCELHSYDASATQDQNNLVSPEPLFGQQLAPVLRQPLGRIIANAETIGSKLQGPIRDSYATYAKDIANAARHLVALVDDLGDLEAIERPDFSTAKDNIELGDLSRRVAGLLALKAADHRITILIPPEELIVSAKAEFRRVLQILINLVTNAIRYSPVGTEVSISIDTKGELAKIAVSDEGAGIDPDNQQKIFEKFERLGRSGDGGSGLGLYISRRLARAMGGELEVANSKQGGAIFTLTLPTK
jgi:two-component sensor histidine kinase